jgi:hypothetical protein
MTPEEAKVLLTPAERAIRDDFYSSDNVVDEVAVERCGRRSAFTFKLGYVPVHCGTVKVRVVTRFHRSGEGALAIHPETLLVDNETGNCAVFYREPLPYGASILASYRYKIDQDVTKNELLPGQYDPRLLDTFIAASKQIFDLTKRGQPNWIWISGKKYTDPKKALVALKRLEKRGYTLDSAPIVGKKRKLKMQFPGHFRQRLKERKK